MEKLRLLCYFLVPVLAYGHAATVVTNYTFLPLQRLVYADNHLYVGGKDMLYKLNENTLTVLDNKTVAASSLCTDECKSSVMTLGRYNSSHLFVCTARHGRCAMVDNSNLNTASQSDDDLVSSNSNNGTVVVVDAPFYDDRSIVPQPALYITSSYSSSSSYALTIMNPDTFQAAYQAAGSLSSDGYSSKLKYRDANNVSYVYAFAGDQYRFYLKNRWGESFLGGMCREDDRFNTLTELPLQCTSQTGSIRKYLMSAFVSEVGEALFHSLERAEAVAINSTEQFLFGVFADNPTSTDTSVCAYSVTALTAKLKQVFNACHIEGNNLDVQVGSPEFKLASPLSCQSIDSLSQSYVGKSPCEIGKQSEFIRRGSYFPIVSLRQMVHASILDLNFAATAIHINVVASYTLAFMVSPTGSFYKVVLGAAGSFRRGVYKHDNLTHHISDSLLQPSIAVGANRLYALTADKVLSVPMQSCTAASTCMMCTQSFDPLCGWCTLTHRCTTMEGCPRSETDGHWLQENASKQSGCVQADIDDSNISLDKAVPSQKVNLNIVPVGGNYECCYFVGAEEMCFDGDKKSSQVGLNAVEKPYIECPSPDRAILMGRIAPDTDHVITNLTLKVDGSIFVQVSLTFYTCSKHSSCTSCVTTTSVFQCRWCLSSRVCYEYTTATCDGSEIIHEKSSISSGDQSGPGYCPRIEAIDSPRLIVASGTRPSLSFRLLHKQENMDSFTCRLKWDDQTRTYNALVEDGGRRLTCQPDANEVISYVGSEATKDVELAIALSSRQFLDNPSSVFIEMYKCERMKETCSECLSVVDAAYGCGWCQDKTSNCLVRQFCPSEGTFLEKNSSCPNIEISKITPTTGPVQGGTLLTIKGVNLGKSYSEIEDGVKILLGTPSLKCEVDNSLEFNPSRLICKTPESTAGSGRVQVSVNEKLSAVSASSFSYHVVIVKRLSVTRGPKSGGSQVAVVGDYVNIGASQKVTLLTSDTIDCKIVASDNTSELVFETPAIEMNQNVSVVLRIDGTYNSHNLAFSFVNDSTITRVYPTKGILSGGTTVHIFGTDLDIIQAPKMYIELLSDVRMKRSSLTPSPSTRKEFPCTDVTASQMKCTLPEIPDSWKPTAGVLGNLSYGFILDGIKSVHDLSSKDGFTQFTIYPDPTLQPIDNSPVTPGSTLRINGENLLAIGPDEVVKPMVKVDFDGEDGSSLSCTVTTISSNILYCKVPELEASKSYKVVVKYGTKLTFSLGTVSRTASNNLTKVHIIGIIAACVAFVAVVGIIIAVLKCKLSQKDEGIKKIQDRLNNLEMTVAKECKEAFTELQTDMPEITADIAALHGLPFYEYKQYCMKVLFPMESVEDHPVMRATQVLGDRDTFERGLRQFRALVYNKTFLLTFVRTLEQQRKFTVREKASLGSFISVALQPNMEYHTDILKTLLAELIERTMDSKKDPKILFRRAESVAEKMLANWFSFLLQKFLKECAGEPLYLLFRAIKQQIDKGPVDAITSDAKYSLSEDKLLRQSIENQSITLRFCSPDPHAAQDPQSVKVLNCDTVSQAIDKILDSLYRNVPNSNKPSKDDLILEWLKPNGERVAMSDDDPAFNKMEQDSKTDYKKLVTLQCYQITDNAMVALSQRPVASSSLPRHVNYRRGISHKIYEYMVSSLSILSQTDDDQSTYTSSNTYGSTGDSSMSRANSYNNILDTRDGAKERRPVVKYHLVKPSEADTHQEGEKMVSEIYLNRLLFIKGTLQNFVDDLFETIFSTSHRGSALPLAIKYMFDFLDDQALLNNISSPDVIHHWKSNSLPLRFWVTVIKNPDFVFDIHKSNIVDACLTVVAQVFMDSCSLTEHRLGKDSPSSKLLYAKDIPKYRKWVDRYYSDVKSMPAISDQDMNVILGEESRQHRSEFNTNAALCELYQYVIKYRSELMTALREDEFARKDRLADQLNTVDQLLNFSSRMPH